MKQALSLFAIILLLLSCQEEAKQNLEEINKKSAREVTLMTVQNGDTVYHITRQLIWLQGEKIAEKTDTIITANKATLWSEKDTTLLLNKVPIYVTVQ
jgi:lipopolysaccharide assembly outer membrane protein LptD (OstA)